MIIAVDFDGTIVTHKYPEIGEPIPGAIEWLKRFQAEGAKLILWTMRSGAELEDAALYLMEMGVIVDKANQDIEPPVFVHESRKVYADIYIDDRNAGCPVTKPKANEPYQVNWQLIGPNVIIQLQKAKGGEPNPWQASSPLQKSPVAPENDKEIK